MDELRERNILYNATNQIIRALGVRVTLLVWNGSGFTVFTYTGRCWLCYCRKGKIVFRVARHSDLGYSGRVIA